VPNRAKSGALYITFGKEIFIIFVFDQNGNQIREVRGGHLYKRRNNEGDHQIESDRSWHEIGGNRSAAARKQGRRNWIFDNLVIAHILWE
jgi:hypothetical protein